MPHLHCNRLFLAASFDFYCQPLLFEFITQKRIQGFINLILCNLPKHVDDKCSLACLLAVCENGYLLRGRRDLVPVTALIYLLSI